MRKENIQRAKMVGLIAANFLAACSDRGLSQYDINQTAQTENNNSLIIESTNDPYESLFYKTRTPRPYPTRQPTNNNDQAQYPNATVKSLNDIPPLEFLQLTPTKETGYENGQIVNKLEGETAKELPDIFYEDVRRWYPLVEMVSKEFEVDPRIVMVIIQYESSGDPDAQNGDALGLGGVLRHNFGPEEDPFDPETNIRKITDKMEDQLISSDSIAVAIAGYSGGDLGRDLISGKITEDEFKSKLAERFIKYNEMTEEEAGIAAENKVVEIRGSVASKVDLLRRSGYTD